MIFTGPRSPAQAKAGNYKKRKVQWQGLTISIENEAGSIRRGKSRDGHEWEQRMVFPYGEILRTTGVDGDPVDVFLGPNMDAPTVYIVHQKTYGDWDKYDEDKCGVGFLSEDEAAAAFLANYNDPRFLGPITAMPVSEFVAKAKATKDAPAMIKAVLFFKSRVDAYIRGGRIVRAYTNKKVVNSRKDSGPSQLTLVFPKHGDYQTVPPPMPPPAPNRMFYVTMIRDPGPRQKVAWLAGPFATHEEALAQVEPARAKANEVDAFSAFDAFGTASVESDNHKPGKLNTALGL